MGIFNDVPKAKINRSKFDLTHEKKMSIGFGNLYPCLIQEVVPGDDFKIKTQSLIRMAPLISPVMHRINVYIHYFYVPNHVIWKDWDDFITQDYAGQTGIGDNATYQLVPHKALDSEVSTGDLLDYMGVPPGGYDAMSSPPVINTLPFRAYYKIWNDFYRDENLSTEIDIENFESGSWDTLQFMKRSWKKDYFTSCLPFAQKGPSPVIQGFNTREADTMFYPDNAGNVNAGSYLKLSGSTGPNGSTFYNSDNAVKGNIDDGLVPAIDIKEIRLAEKIQSYLEKLYRSGHRYIEYLRGIWGVQSDDLRLMRPQYIGGGVSPIVISEVLNTTGQLGTELAPEGLPQGNMAGHGISVGVSNQAECYCKYHGWIIGILSVLPEAVYQDGIDRSYLRMDPFDYYIPDLAQMGEQEVKKVEVFVDKTSNGHNYNNGTFGYQSRFAEYKYGKSTLHGAFRDTLSHWTMARKFSQQSVPTLNEDFILCDPDMDIFAVVDNKNEEMYVQLLHEIIATRPMPFFNVPSL